MFTFIARSAWAEEEGLRLDAATYASGGLEERDHITLSRRLPSWRRLASLAELRYEGRFARKYVRDENLSVPFLTASDIQLADLKGMLRLSIKRTPQLPSLLLEEGWSLLSRSGTIGKVAYVRAEMAGMAASDDIIRCIPRPAVIYSGYLFAFLAGAQAQVMIRQKTYGNVIQHIEPEHIADMPVPIPNDAFQERIHGLVTRAAEARTEASRLLDAASGYFDALAGPMPSSHDHAYALGVVRSRDLDYRLDAFHHVGWASEAKFDAGDRIDSLAEIISTNRVPRVYIAEGIPFLSGIDVFRFRPSVRVHLAPYIADAFAARVSAGDIAIQGSGQRYGLLGRPAYIGKYMDGWAASHDLFRIRAQTLRDTSRIYAFLRSESGHRVMLRHSYGTSIPHVNPYGIADICIPALPPDLDEAATRAIELREQADADEDIAIREVEAWVG